MGLPCVFLGFWELKFDKLPTYTGSCIMYYYRQINIWHMTKKFNFLIGSPLSTLTLNRVLNFHEGSLYQNVSQYLSPFLPIPITYVSPVSQHMRAKNIHTKTMWTNFFYEAFSCAKRRCLYQVVCSNEIWIKSIS